MPPRVDSDAKCGTPGGCYKPDNHSSPRTSLLSGLRDTLAMYTRSGPISMQNMVPPYPNPHLTPHNPPGTLCTGGSLCCPNMKYGRMISSSNTPMNIFTPPRGIH